MNLIEEGMLETLVKAAQYGVRVKEIVLPKGQYLAFAHACKEHHPDVKPRSYMNGNRADTVQVPDSFKFAAPQGWVVIRMADDVPSPQMVGIAAEMVEERIRQIFKFGEQHHPDGTGDGEQVRDAEICRMACDTATRLGYLDWGFILREEVAEALAERDPAKLRAELIQVAAVCAAWVEDIDSRK